VGFGGGEVGWKKKGGNDVPLKAWGIVWEGRHVGVRMACFKKKKGQWGKKPVKKQKERR